MDQNRPVKKHRFTPVSLLHFFRLGYRSALFIVLAIIYIDFRMDLQHGPALLQSAGLLADPDSSTWFRTAVLGLIWIV